MGPQNPPEVLDTWAAAFADRWPQAARVARQKAREARTYNARVTLPGADVRELAGRAVRPRERRDASGRSGARSGDSPDDGEGSELPPAPEHGERAT
jgi:hypothetical protein